MNGIGTKGKAKKLMKTITRFSEIMVKQKNVFPNGGNALDVEFVLVPMSAFLVSGFANDNDVAFQMLPTYQKKIMPYVNKEEYDEKTARFQELFTEYREKAIEVQENNEDWFWKFIYEFADLTAKNMGSENTDDAKKTIGACIVELINTINPKLNI